MKENTQFLNEAHQFDVIVSLVCYWLIVVRSLNIDAWTVGGSNYAHNLYKPVHRSLIMVLLALKG